MKILILNTSERAGGAAVAANRLMRALLKVGCEVSMLVRDKETDDPHVVSVNVSFWRRLLNQWRFVWERGVIYVCNLFSREHLFQVSIANTGTDVSRHPLVREADVIHIHWINQGFLSLRDIQKLMRLGKPVVWTLHDLWVATGICHYPGGCQKYTMGCDHCPMMRANPLVDLAASVFRRKERADLSRIFFVGCSEWIVEETRKSALLRDALFTSIPNPIDMSVFHRRDREMARKRFGLPLDKFLLLFAAAKVSDSRKGAIYLIKACEELQARYGDDMEIVLMGVSTDEWGHLFPFKVNALGYLGDPSAIADAYSSVDVFVIPSLEDNLPNTIMEAMACGTPCVGFRTGGIPEMIDHQVNGYVADYRDVGSLAKGIDWVISHRDSLSLSDACVSKVRRRYRDEAVAGRYVSLYEHLLTPRTPHDPPIFSIITVTYNAEKWIERTILSVISQSYRQVEYILVDGASTDGTVDIIRRFELGISEWISEPDKGLYDAMNKGLRMATGDYVWFLNAGDTFHSPDTLRNIVASLPKDQPLPDVIYGETQIVDAWGNPVGMRRLKVPERLTWRSFQRGMLVCHQSFVVRRSTAPSYDLSYRLTADYDWCLRCLRRAVKAHNTCLTLSNYLEEGMSTLNRKASLRERYAIMCKYYGKILTILWHGWFAVRFYFAKWVKGRV